MDWQSSRQEGSRSSSVVELNMGQMVDDVKLAVDDSNGSSDSEAGRNPADHGEIMKKVEDVWYDAWIAGKQRR